MSEKQYNVDEILEEVRKKRQERGQTADPVPENVIASQPFSPQTEESMSSPMASQSEGEKETEEPKEKQLSKKRFALFSHKEKEEETQEIDYSAVKPMRPAHQRSVEETESQVSSFDEIIPVDHAAGGLLFPNLPEPPEPPNPDDGFSVIPVKADGTLDFEKISPKKPVESRFAAPFKMDTQELDADAPTKRADGLPPLALEESPVEEKYAFLQQNRRKKVEGFVLNKETERAPTLAVEDSPIKSEKMERSSLSEQARMEYETSSDREAVLSVLKNLRISLNFRRIATLITALLLLYLDLAPALSLPLPGFLAPALQPVLYCILNLALLLFAAAISYPVIGGGLLNFVKFRANADSMTALAAIAGLLQAGILAFFPNQMVESRVELMACLPALCLFFNAVGKRQDLRRISSNFQLASSSEGKYAAALTTRKLAASFSQIVELDAPIVAASIKTQFLSRFMEISNSETPADRIARTLCPICAFCSLGMLVLSLVLGTQMVVSVSAVAAAFAVCAPFSSILCSSLPMYRVNKSLRRERAAVTGYQSAEEFEDLDSLVLNASDLFPEGSIQLHGIKTMGLDRIDDHILDAASIVCAAKSTLEPVFLQVIEGQTKLLRPVDNVVYEDGMGLSGWVDGRRVLIGNRELLENHSIPLPSREYEMRFLRDRREVVYLATSGEISAMFVISYHADPQIAQAFERLMRSNLSVLIKSTDPNITPKKVAQVFTFPVTMVKIIPGKAYGEYQELVREKEVMPSQVILENGGMPPFAAGMYGVRTIRQSVTLSCLLQTIGVVLGFLMVLLLALISVDNLGSLTLSNLLLYQTLWLALSVGLPALKKI